jgi:hypothetical protein
VLSFYWEKVIITTAFKRNQLILSGILSVELDEHRRHVNLLYIDFIRTDHECVIDVEKSLGKSWKYLFNRSWIYYVQNPAFGVAQIRAVTEIFVEKAVQVRFAFVGGFVSFIILP